MNPVQRQILPLTAVFLVSPVLSQSIGTGEPGLKVASKQSGGIVIFLDEPEIIGNAYVGGMQKRQLKVLIDHGFGFDQQTFFKQVPLVYPRQLYPIDSNSAFSCTNGCYDFKSKTWSISNREITGYKLLDGRISIFQNVQSAATSMYGLDQQDVFLGYIKGRAFFWKIPNPTKLYWLESDSRITKSISLPKDVFDLYGVIIGTKKDIAIVCLRPTHGFFFKTSINSIEAIELDLSKGVVYSP